MHVLPTRHTCLFGCGEGLDEISHYLQCRRALHWVTEPPKFAHREVLHRLGLGALADYPDEAAHEFSRQTTVRNLVLLYYLYLEV